MVDILRDYLLAYSQEEGKIFLKHITKFRR